MKSSPRLISTGTSPGVPSASHLGRSFSGSPLTQSPSTNRAPELPGVQAGNNASAAATVSTEIDTRLAIRRQLPFDPDPNVVRLFFAIDALRSDAAPFVVQFLSTVRGEGTTTISAAYAVAASVDYPAPVLLVDCSPGDGMSLTKALVKGGSMSSAIRSLPGFRRLYAARLCNSENPLLSMDGAPIKAIMTKLRERFSVVVLDCPPATSGGDSFALSRIADGTVLVVRAGKARRRAVAWTREVVERSGGKVIGSVLNDRRMHIPDWLYKRM